MGGYGAIFSVGLFINHEIRHIVYTMTDPCTSHLGIL